MILELHFERCFVEKRVCENYLIFGRLFNYCFCKNVIWEVPLGTPQIHFGPLGALWAGPVRQKQIFEGVKWDPKRNLSFR